MSDYPTFREAVSYFKDLESKALPETAAGAKDNTLNLDYTCVRTGIDKAQISKHLVNSYLLIDLHKKLDKLSLQQVVPQPAPIVEFGSNLLGQYKPPSKLGIKRKRSRLHYES
ncbi:p12 [Agapanthus tungrovirus]|uniref:p12 n=1 Tax=Agapanthus tungrovirus TaxID=2838078 RepID=A0A8E7NHD1_9VIRU|nr:p12 [Agapanthus tungrovirus]QVY19167.1 p12 [Agapanthus tungrovirus]